VRVHAEPPTVLVVDDDRAIRIALERALRLEGFDVDTAAGGERALELIGERRPSVVLLDVMMPDLSGVEVARRLRGDGVEVPICMLSARDEVADRVAGLEAGADDYIVKPFEPLEMMARVRAQLRRAQQLSRDDGHSILRAGRLVVDSELQDALVDERRAGLTQKEFQLLYLLATRAGKAVSRDFLIEQLWSGDELGSDKNVAVYIRRIRQKIERDPDAPEILLTVRGYGYRIAA
jgi:DNA-binding response OmpR family regulator